MFGSWDAELRFSRGHWILEPRRVGLFMRRQVWAMGIVALLFCLSMVGFATAQADEVYEPGFVEWEIVPHERLFVEGFGIEDAVLQRGQTDSAVGGYTTGATNGVVQIFSLTSPPVNEPIETNVMMSVYLSATLDGGVGPQTCTRANSFGGASTTLIYSVNIGGSEVYTSSVEQIIDKVGENDAMNFSGERQNVSISMMPGDAITLTVSIDHRCIPAQARVQWGGFEHNSGGIIMEGVIFQPEARITVDSARRAHIELDHRLPWGLEDLKDERWEIWGPLESGEKSTRDGEFLVETSAGRIRMVRDAGNNETVYAWTGAKALPVGEMNLNFCMRTMAGDLNSDCHAEGILRFEVTKGNTGFANAALILSATTLLALLGFVLNAFRSGLLLPVPILVALLGLALLTLPTAFDQPNLGADAVIQPTTKVIDSQLEPNEGSTVQISELMDGYDALIIGVVLPGSENVLVQADEFNRSLDNLEGRAKVIQIVTGEDARMSDVTSLQTAVNATWQVYLDVDHAFASSLPTGLSDAVVIIDPAFHVTASFSGSAGMLTIVESVEAIETGGQNSATAYFGLILGPGLFLLFLALPREEWSAPEEPLPPGLLWGSIIIASGAGILMVNLPALVFALLPVGVTARFILDIAMMAWMLEMCFFTAKRGAPFEADLLGRLMHSVFPKAFREWRDPVDMDRDVLLGVWLGWFGWLSFPALFPQGIGATALLGGTSMLTAFFLLLLYVLIGGFVVLLLRIVSSWGGPFSRLFGKFGGEVFAQFVGWVLTPVALWVALNTVINVVELGVI